MFYPANFVLHGSFRSPVRSRHATDGRTERQTVRQTSPSFYNASSYAGRSIISNASVYCTAQNSVGK